MFQIRDLNILKNFNKEISLKTKKTKLKNKYTRKLKHKKDYCNNLKMFC